MLFFIGTGLVILIVVMADAYRQSGVVPICNEKKGLNQVRGLPRLMSQQPMMARFPCCGWGGLLKCAMLNP